MTSSPLSLFFTKPPNPPFPKLNPKKLTLIPCTTIDRRRTTRAATVSEKVQTLDCEFKSLPEPIDRVKRLLQYASVLPPFDEASRIQENRVAGCTTQVWVEARMDGNGAMRFSADSDSEITKGFCSCLVWVLDGGGAEEVLGVKGEDLIGMNVGLPSRGRSRVNTWHNVLISMQRRTRDLVEERRRGRRGGSSTKFDTET